MSSIPLFANSIWFTWLAISGNYTAFVHPRFGKFIWMAALILAVIGCAQLHEAISIWRRNSRRDVSRTRLALPLLLSVPALVGLTWPADELSPSASENRAYAFDRVASPPNTQADRGADYEQNTTVNIKVTNDTFVAVCDALWENPDEYLGRTIEAIGFIYADNKLPNRNFVLGRYIITCCAADASVIGMLCRYGEAHEPIPRPNTWVRVRAKVERGLYGDHPLGILAISDIRETKKPREAYVYQSGVTLD